MTVDDQGNIPLLQFHGKISLRGTKTRSHWRVWWKSSSWSLDSYSRFSYPLSLGTRISRNADRFLNTSIGRKLRYNSREQSPHGIQRYTRGSTLVKRSCFHYYWNHSLPKNTQTNPKDWCRLPGQKKVVNWSPDLIYRYFYRHIFFEGQIPPGHLDKFLFPTSSIHLPVVLQLQKLSNYNDCWRHGPPTAKIVLASPSFTLGQYHDSLWRASVLNSKLPESSSFLGSNLVPATEWKISFSKFFPFCGRHSLAIFAETN